MVGIEQHAAVGQAVLGAVREADSAASLRPNRAARAVVGDPAEREQHAHVRQRGKLRGRKRPAGGDLVRQRLVLRRQAFDRVEDHRPASANPSSAAPVDTCRQSGRPPPAPANRKSPASSPVNGRPVRFAPRMPGARPTMASQACRIAPRGHRRVPPLRLVAAQFLAATRPGAGTAGNRAAARYRRGAFHAHAAVTQAGMNPPVVLSLSKTAFSSSGANEGLPCDKARANRFGAIANALDSSPMVRLHRYHRARLEPAAPALRLAAAASAAALGAARGRRCARDRAPRRRSKRDPVGPRSGATPMPPRLSRPARPDALLALLKRIERDFGRRPGGQRWGARVLDLDIVLWCGGACAPAPGLTIPHPLSANATSSCPALAGSPGLARPAHRRDRAPAPRAVDRAPRPLPR